VCVRRIPGDVVHGESAADIPVRPEIRRVRVASDSGECAALAAARNQQRHVRLLNRTGPHVRFLHVEVTAFEGERLGTPDAAHDLDRLVEHLLTFGWRRERDAEPRELRLVVADAQAQHEPPVAEPVDVGCHPGQDDRMSVVDTAHERTQPDRARAGRQDRQRRPAVGAAHGSARVVDRPVRVEAEPLNHLDEVARLGPARRWVLRAPGDPEPNASRALGDPGVARRRRSALYHLRPYLEDTSSGQRPMA
jgi:hypothetical protein